MGPTKRSSTQSSVMNAIKTDLRSSREEDDEEALKWAALEKLPTYDRIRKGMLLGSIGASKEIDVDSLGLQERMKLLERLVRVAEEDNEKFLLKLKNRMERVGIDIPTIEVRYENLNIEAAAHVGGRSLPTMFNFALNMIESLFNQLHILPNRKKPIAVLHDVSGIIKPRRMTLVLGPPGSGKTSLLLALAGKLSSDLKVSGRVTYNGHGLNEFVPERTAAYISQHDLHIGEMTVRETLAFSARCQGVGTRYDMLVELSRREKEANIKPDPDIDVFMKAASLGGQQANVITDYILKILGLDICADTMVGDEMIRGISGGQRKRVTTGEMLVGPSRALFMDEISTGLDSSTTFQIVKALRQSNHILGGTTAISLLQPAPETYNLFDDIILLSDGHIVYHGPRENVLEFFESMGFKCPERKGVADFLQEVTSRKDQQQYWVRQEQYRYVPVKELAEAFQSFHVGRRMGEELATPFDKSKSHPAALTTSKYGASNKELLRALIWREYLLMKRNSFVYIFKLIQLTIMAIITMTVFFRTKMHRDSVTDGGIYAGAVFFAVIMIMFNGFAELAMTIQKLPVFYKQRDFLFFPTWIYSLPTWILKIPISFLEVAVWVFMTYYVIGFDPSATRGYKEMVEMGLLDLPSNTLPDSKEPLGVRVLKSRGVFPEAKWYWIAIGAMVGYILVFNAWYTLALKYLNALGGSEAAVSEETMQEKHMNRTGEMIELSNERSPRGNRGERTSGSTGAEGTDNGNQNERGMVLPFTPLSITFDNMRYSVDMPQEMKAQGIEEDRLMLLKGVSGAFRPGVLTALMGVSGAGKTTLMDVLAGRKTGGYIEGSITISGYPKNQETFARISGYCEQNDIHSPHLTIYESLIFSAWLRLPADVNSATRKMFIEQVMELVELTTLRDSLVGLPGVDGLSTEQRKRLTIAVELVANPSIIFMDEPTSGLDARAAAIVMRTVRNTVDTGRTVVCTIHQPSIDIFEAFDELFLMKRGGEEIYVGPLGRQSCHLIEYFEGVNGVSKITDGYNPATWMLEVTTMAQEEALGVNFVEFYKNSPLFEDIQQNLFNAAGSMYTAVLFLGISNASSVQPVVAIERTVFYRERAAGMYSALPYAFGQVAIEVPYIFIQAVIYGVVVYAMIGFEWTAAKFFWYIFYMYFTLLYFTYYGMMAVGVTPNHNIAAIVSAAFYSIWNLFSGFLIPRPFGDITKQMKDGDKDTVEKFVRDYFGFKHDFLGIVALMVVGFTVLFAFIFAFSIKAISQRLSSNNDLPSMLLST
ncbi:Pleiotropic drug resistance protein 3 [Acorus gramineus]|uniref:Pleiotropic drug resistance protein 3 n=1 Tax=Acorus gramineus TaxID=55184 RepID=A0AAV9AMS5_ACOGR|nr:Pleiotropic drug resistance protein 3 [Acorus gramineus]